MRWPKKLAEGAIVALLASSAAGCAVKRFEPPADAGLAVADAAAAWSAAAAPCLGVRTLTAELALSGKVGDTRMRGRVQAGFQAPGRIRLEGVAPFGQPVFILVGDAERATLLLPRDERVVRASAAAEILEALAGVRLAPDALRAVVAGCVMTASPTSATDHGDVRRFVFPDGIVYTRTRGGTTRIVAATLPPFLVEYPDAFVLGQDLPRRVRIWRTGTGGDAVDLSISVSQIETNTSLPAAAFTIDVPPGTMPMTIEELRNAGPLGVR